MDSNSPKATEAELARMMEQYGARLAAVCALMLGDRDLAQDIVQETFIRAYQRLECFRGERQESERAWLTSIAVNLCKNERKKSWFRFIDRKTPIDALNLPTEDAPQEKKAVVHGCADSTAERMRADSLTLLSKIDGSGNLKDSASLSCNNLSRT